MTTYVDFIPSQVAPFQFNPTLDGQVYAARVPWNLFGQRYYIELRALDGTLIFYQPLIGSPIGVQIQDASWQYGRVMLQTASPHGYRLGQTINLTVSGCQPVTYDGRREFLVTGHDLLSYPERAYPGAMTDPGRLDYDVDLAGGYFQTSTLVFREPSQRFEITP